MEKEKLIKNFCYLKNNYNKNKLKYLIKNFLHVLTTTKRSPSNNSKTH